MDVSCCSPLPIRPVLCISLIPSPGRPLRAASVCHRSASETLRPLSARKQVDIGACRWSTQDPRERLVQAADRERGYYPCVDLKHAMYGCASYSWLVSLLPPSRVVQAREQLMGLEQFAPGVRALAEEVLVVGLFACSHGGQPPLIPHRAGCPERCRAPRFGAFMRMAVTGGRV